MLALKGIEYEYRAVNLAEGEQVPDRPRNPYYLERSGIQKQGPSRWAGPRLYL